jgi:hypothetical protein
LQDEAKILDTSLPKKKMRKKRLHNLLMGLLAIISSCSIKIVNKEKVLYSEKGLLFATNEESYIFIPSSYKNSTNIQYGYNITNKYDKYFRRRPKCSLVQKPDTQLKKDYFQDLNLQSTNPLYYV